MSFKLVGSFLSTLLIMLSSYGTPPTKDTKITERSVLASKVQVSQNLETDGNILLIDKEWFEEYEAIQIALYDLKGQELGSIPLKTNRINLSTRLLQSGFYFIQLKDQDKVLLTRRIKVD